MTTYINADNGVVSGVAGLKYSADSSGVLVLQTNTTNALTLDSTQNATFATGILATNPFTGTYTDGTIVDYITGVGRINVGPSDDIAFYHNGIGSRTEIARFTYTGRLGVGTASPISRLQVVGVAGNTAAYIQGVAGTLNIDYNGGGYNYYDGTAQIFRTFAGVTRAGLDFSSVNTAFTLTAGTGGYAAQYINSTGTAYLIYQTNSTETGRVVVDSSSNMIFGTGSAGTERMRIDSVGTVAINTTGRPAGVGGGDNGKLWVKQTTTGNFGVSAIASATDSFTSIGHNGTVATVATSYGTTGSYTGIAFFTQDVERMRVNAGAPILCLAGGNTSATGTGIAFPATQSASSDANTLDDYEEGSWSPVLTTDGTAFTSGGQNGSAWYEKIGSLVHVFGYFGLAGAVSGGTGNILLTGLPFTIYNSPGYIPGAFSAGRLTLSTNGYYWFILNSNTTTLAINSLVSGNNPATLAASAVNGNPSPYIPFNFTYRAA